MQKSVTFNTGLGLFDRHVWGLDQIEYFHYGFVVKLKQGAELHC